MTIVSVTKAWSKTGSSRGSEDFRNFTATFKEGYQVVHSVDASENEILSSIPVTLGDYYPGSFAKCTKVGDVSKVGPIFSIVPVEFQGKSGPLGTTDNPLNAPAIIDWDHTTSTEPIDSDVNGMPIVTANGEQITGATMDICDTVLNIQKNFAVFTPWIQQVYLHSVNSDVFASWAPGLGRMKVLKAKEQKANGFSYFSVTASIHFRVPYNTTAERAWWGRSRHEGFYERPAVCTKITFSGGGGTGAAAVPIVDSSGVITGVFVTARGSGYTSAPSVSASVGSGATFTANLRGSTGQVGSVTVTAGGTGYKGRVQRAQENGEPTVKPVLLKYDGTRETNPNNAVWIEIEKYKPLPYNALGFF